MGNNFDTLFIKLTENALASQKEGLKKAIDYLKENGFFIFCLPSEFGGKNWSLTQSAEETKTVFSVLRHLGRSNLSVARLFEGHLNAVRLIQLYAKKSYQNKVFEEISQGSVLGVWGADGFPPLSYVVMKDDKIELTGMKRFASGLDYIDKAVVTMRQKVGDADELAVIDVADKNRQNKAEWDCSGMGATQSGTYDFSDIVITNDDLIGLPASFQIEPHFQGGIWRYCAAHLGGAEGLVLEWMRMLEKRNRLDDAFQLSRLATAYAYLTSLSAMLEKVALKVESASRQTDENNIEEAVLAALLGRKQTEDACLKTMYLCEKSLGMEAFMQRNPIEYIRRDLDVFIRQAAPDAKNVLAAKLMIKRNGEALW